MVFEYLREGSKDDSAKLLNSIREAQSVDDFIKSFSEAAPLIPLAPQQSYSLAIASQFARVASSRPIEDLSLGTEPLSITDELVTRFPDGVLPVS
ncbi:hypothetical protein FVEN_g12972 [Fusarium venenatum]|nr:hypothetical protein FVEN_g12972 [Fusarium venenatum]